MQVQFGTDGKRINSTKIPTLTDTKTCVLKRPCSVESPVLELSTFNPRWSVAYIPDFHRYYFVSNIESVSNSITRYYLTVDPLASFKQRILAHRLNVARSESHGVTTQIDPLATHDAMTPNFYEQTFSLSGADFSVGGGTYILQTIGKGTTSNIGESVNTYAVTSTNLKNLIDKLFTASTYNEQGNVTIAAAEKTYFNPIQYVISCKWFPISIAGTSDTIKFGWWDSGISCYSVQTYTRGVSATIVMPAAVDWTYTDSRFSRYFATIPGFGNIEIDPKYAGNNISCQIVVDILTGAAKLKLIVQTGSGSSAREALIAQASGYWAVEVMLAQLSTDIMKMSNNALNNMSTELTGMNYGDLLQGGLQGMDKVNSGYVDQGFAMSINVLGLIPHFGMRFQQALTDSVQPMSSICGATGNMSDFKVDTYIRLAIIHYDVLEPNLVDTVGLPCNRNLLLSDLTGFTQCNNASISIQSATSGEKTAIKGFLEGGFWIE